MTVPARIRRHTPIKINLTIQAPRDPARGGVGSKSRCYSRMAGPVCMSEMACLQQLNFRGMMCTGIMK